VDPHAEAASLATVDPMSMALQPNPSSLVIASTSPASSLSSRRAKPRRSAVATLPETVSVMIRRDSMLKLAAWSLLELVVGNLSGGGNANVGEGARHGLNSSEKAARN